MDESHTLEEEKPPGTICNFVTSRVCISSGCWGSFRGGEVVTVWGMSCPDLHARFRDMLALLEDYGASR